MAGELCAAKAIYIGASPFTRQKEGGIPRITQLVEIQQETYQAGET